MLGVHATTLTWPVTGAVGPWGMAFSLAGLRGVARADGFSCAPPASATATA